MSRKGFIITLAVVAVAIMLEIVSGYLFAKAAEEAWSIVCPMANTNISWQQTYYPGPWDGAER